MAAASGLSQMEKGGEKVKSIGIDIGKRRCIVCTVDRNGTVLEETGYENTYAAATALARKAKREYGKCQAVCESTGNLWIKTYEAFEDRGIPIELANPMKVRAIAGPASRPTRWTQGLWRTCCGQTLSQGVTWQKGG